MLKLIKNYGKDYILAPVKRSFWKFFIGIGIIVGILVNRFMKPKVKPKRVGDSLYYPSEIIRPKSEAEYLEKLAQRYHPPESIKFIWVRFIWPVQAYWKKIFKKRDFADWRKVDGEVLRVYQTWNIHIHKMMITWYRTIRPFIIKMLRRISYFIRIRIIYDLITHPIEVACRSFWNFWGWNGTFWSWEFWYSQYYSVREWFIPNIMNHINELDEMFKKIIIFEWQYNVQEQTLDIFNRIYAIPMRPDSFSDFILIGITILTVPISLLLTELEWSAILKNLVNTILQISLIIIIIRMLVTVFWSQHLTMYILLHPICFAVLLFSRSLANGIYMDDEEILDTVIYWAGYFFIMTWMWQLDIFFIH